MSITTIPINRRSFLDGITYLIFQIFVFLVPVFFIPTVSVAFQTGRTFFILIGIAVLLFLWIVARLKDGTFSIPKSLFYASAALPIVTYALATVFSPNASVSLAGFNYELGTFWLFTSSFLLFALTPFVVRSEPDIRRIYKVLFASFIVVALYEGVKFIFGADALSFGVLSGMTANLIGKWNDVGIFAGAVALLSAITLDRGMRDKGLRILGWTSFVLSLVLLVIINFKAVWIVLFFAALIVFVYSVSSAWARRMANPLEKLALPTTTLVLLVLSIVFMFAGSTVGAFVSDAIGVTNIEARPSWALTGEISGKVVGEDPLFGVGPNRFSSVWLENKPVDINNTLFWNVDFNYGIGFIPTLISTTGIIGFLGILAFMGMFLYAGGRAVFAADRSSPAHYLVLSSFVVALFLWVFAVIYVPSATIWMITLLMTGLVVGSAIAAGAMNTFHVSAIESQLKSFFAVLFSVLALIGVAFFAYKVSTKTFANISFQQGIIAVNRDGSLEEGERLIRRALSLAPSDAHYRFLADIYLARLGAVIQNDDLLPSELQTQFQALLGSAIAAAQEAIAYDSTNYQNYVALGRVYEAIVPLGVQGSYESAKKAYEDALARNPQSPEIPLLLARLEVANSDTAAARDYIGQALSKKSNYADAVFFLSQLEAAEGRLPQATAAAENLALLSPNDSGVFFQLGFFLYRGGNYPRAVQALERAVALNPEYANAKYFLGLAYYETDNVEGAIKQFEDLTVTNPDNEEVKGIIANLKAGRPPLPAGTTAPERRENPPIEE